MRVWLTATAFERWLDRQRHRYLHACSLTRCGVHCQLPADARGPLAHDQHAEARVTAARQSSGVEPLAVIGDRHPQLPIFGHELHIDMLGGAGMLAHVGQRLLHHAQELHPGGWGQGLGCADVLDITGYLQASVEASVLAKTGHSLAQRAA